MEGWCSGTMRTGMSSTDSGVGVSLPTSCDGFPDSSETGLQRLLQLQALNLKSSIIRYFRSENFQVYFT